MSKLAITQSMLISLMTCPRLAYYQYFAGGRGIKSTAPYAPFIEGDFGHYALQHFYKSGKMLKANLMKRCHASIDNAGAQDVDVAVKLEVQLAAKVGA